MIAGAVDEGICLLEFHDRRMLPTQYERVQSLLNATMVERDHHHIQTLRIELKEYFENG